MKIDKLVLLTGDKARVKEFYSKKLHLEIISEDEICLSFRAGNTLLVFKLTAVGNPVYHVAFNIPKNKINEASGWCEENGIKLVPYPPGNKIIDFPNWNAKSIYFFDDTGNILEFIARSDLQNENRMPFDAMQILRVSEIGMVVADVNGFCDQVKEKYGIPVYEKQKPSPNFSVMGDAEGLMIVVPENRMWFPTGITSRKFPVGINLQQGSIRYEITA